MLNFQKQQTKALCLTTQRMKIMYMETVKHMSQTDKIDGHLHLTNQQHISPNHHTFQNHHTHLPKFIRKSSQHLV